jgi:hypothetical protein
LSRRRFYLKAVPESSTTRHPVYPLWFVPALVVVGTLLGLGVYRVTCYSGYRPATVADSQGNFGLSSGTSSPSSGPEELNDAEDAPRSKTSSPVKSVQAVSIEGVRVQVLNGCGVQGLARVITPALRERGLDVRETKNASHFNYRRSLVIDRTGNLSLARAIADSLGIEPTNVSSTQAGNLPDIDVTLIVGADYQRLKLNLKSTR